MEDQEPDNGSYDGCRDEEHESIPGQIPNTELEPLGPDSKEKEKEGETNAKHEPKRCPALGALLLQLENVEAGWVHAHMLHGQDFARLWLLGRWVLRISVLHAVGNDAIHDIEADEAGNELDRVHDTSEVIEGLVRVHHGHHLHDLLTMLQDLDVEVRAKNIVAVDCLLLGSLRRLLLDNELRASALNFE